MAINEDNWLWHPAEGRVPVLTEQQLRPRRGFWAWLFRRPVVVPGRSVRGLHVPVLDERQVRPVTSWDEALKRSTARVPGGRS